MIVEGRQAGACVSYYWESMLTVDGVGRLEPASWDYANKSTPTQQMRLGGLILSEGLGLSGSLPVSCPVNALLNFPLLQPVIARKGRRPDRGNLVVVFPCDIGIASSLGSVTLCSF